MKDQGAYREALHANDVLTNMMAVKVALSIILVELVWVLIGEVNRRQIDISYDVMYGAMAELLLCAAICLAFKEWRGAKHVMVASVVLNAFMVIAGVDYTMMLLMVLPVAVCSMYYRPAFTIIVTAAGAVLMLAGLLINNELSPIMFGFYYGMTYWDTVSSLARVYYMVNVLIFLLASVVCHYATTRGLSEVRRQTALKQEKAEFDREVSAAKGIQRSMLIDEFPLKEQFDIASYMSAAKDVGGDFYDCFTVGSNHLAVVIADVSGKGLPAALFMSRSMTVIRSSVQSVSGLGRAMSKANDDLASNNGMKYFVTVWAALVDVRDGSVEFVNAGHNPPFVGRGGSYSMVECTPGFVFGRKKGIKY
ncbi:MAG: SpoIIE family protein phosphatase [Candidatus Methanomethylophilaceae archaeon]|nr:SpoIIE family protein phosphatase [Candidatus Methanomethylophilaceae archaeon]